MRKPTSACTFTKQASGERIIFSSPMGSKQRDTAHTILIKFRYLWKPEHSEIENWSCIYAWCSGVLYSEHRSYLIFIRRIFLHISVFYQIVICYWKSFISALHKDAADINMYFSWFIYLNWKVISLFVSNRDCPRCVK